MPPVPRGKRQETNSQTYIVEGSGCLRRQGEPKGRSASSPDPRLSRCLKYGQLIPILPNQITHFAQIPERRGRLSQDYGEYQAGPAERMARGGGGPFCETPYGRVVAREEGTGRPGHGTLISPASD